MVFLGVPEVSPKGTEVFALEFSVAPSNFIWVNFLNEVCSKNVYFSF